MKRHYKKEKNKYWDSSEREHLQEKYVPIIRKSRQGVSYTNYKKIVTNA